MALLGRFLRIALVVASVGAAAVRAEPAVDLDHLEARLRGLLRQGIVAGWGLAGASGPAAEATGEPGDPGVPPRILPDEARALWLWSRLHQEGLYDDVALEAARARFAFLRDHMWDRVFGGLFWEMDATGRVGVRPHKQAYGQALALGALAEYGAASGDTTAVGMAGELFDLLDGHAHDAERGGYREWFRRDWGPLPAALAYLPAGPDGQRADTQLEMMSALAAWYSCSADERVRERLVELLLAQLALVAGAPRTGDEGLLPSGESGAAVGVAAGTSLELERLWRLDPACRAAGLPPGLLGGLTGPVLRRMLAAVPDALRRNAAVRAGGVAAALTAFRQTGSEPYLDLARELLDGPGEEPESAGAGPGGGRQVQITSRAVLHSLGTVHGLRHEEGGGR